eukprot:2077460-Amphidinium_carterae.2
MPTVPKQPKRAKLDAKVKEIYSLFQPYVRLAAAATSGFGLTCNMHVLLILVYLPAHKKDDGQG